MLRLPPRMEEVLVLASKKKEVEIAKELGVTRQAVSKSLREARARLTQIFIEVAGVLNSDIVRINVEKGFAVLRNRQTGAKMYLIYVPGEGPRVLMPAPNPCKEASYCAKIVEAAYRWGIIERKEGHAAESSEIIKLLIKRMEE